MSHVFEELFQANLLGRLSQGFVQAKDDRANRRETSDREKARGNVSSASSDEVRPALRKFTGRFPALYTLTMHESLSHQRQIILHAKDTLIHRCPSIKRPPDPHVLFRSNTSASQAS